MDAIVKTIACYQNGPRLGSYMLPYGGLGGHWLTLTYLQVVNSKLGVTSGLHVGLYRDHFTLVLEAVRASDPLIQVCLPVTIHSKVLSPVAKSQQSFIRA